MIFGFYSSKRVNCFVSHMWCSSSFCHFWKWTLFVRSKHLLQIWLFIAIKVLSIQCLFSFISVFNISTDMCYQRRRPFLKTNEFSTKLKDFSISYRPFSRLSLWKELLYLLHSFIATFITCFLFGFLKKNNLI